MSDSSRLLLIILDGWGCGARPEVSAIAQAHTPFIDGLSREGPFSTLVAGGEAVGLPAGQVGNSEVGHLHLGAGRVIEQSLLLIDRAVRTGALAEHPTLCAAFEAVKARGAALHLVGLLSEGGVHAHVSHLRALCEAATQAGVPRFLVHAFGDGRDVPPGRLVSDLHHVEQWLSGTPGQLASMVGRYYAMDRDQRWERTQKAYDALVYGRGKRTTDWRVALEASYAAGVTDEFIEPIVLVDERGKPRGRVQAGDALLCFNFRTDRSRQLIEVLTQPPGRGTLQPLPIQALTMTTYDPRFENVTSLFEPPLPEETLGEVLSRHGKRQLRAAETEKYPHVTYFFSGGREHPFEREERLLVPSPAVATYDLAPAMSAHILVGRLLPVLAQRTFDFVCLNFANADMVGHTGDFTATVRACETVDACLKQVVEEGRRHGYAALVVADHGNAEKMRDGQGNPFTAHADSPVPCFWIGPAPNKRLRNGSLIDIAPTVLDYLKLPRPSVMQGRSLFESS